MVNEFVPKDKLFQFTHPCRMRHIKYVSVDSAELFQFTHPCRMRPINKQTLSLVLLDFNSRIHVGCDNYVNGLVFV